MEPALLFNPVLHRLPRLESDGASLGHHNTGIQAASPGDSQVRLGRQAAEIIRLQVQVQHSLPTVRHEQVQVLAISDHVYVRALVVMEVISLGLGVRVVLWPTTSPRCHVFP